MTSKPIDETAPNAGLPEGAMPQAGDILAFETEPFTHFSPCPTQRHAAIKILGVSEDCIVVAVLDGIWSVRPTLDQAAQCDILKEQRFAFTGEPAVFGVPADWWRTDQLNKLTLVGKLPCKKLERQIAADLLCATNGSRFGTMSSATFAAEGEWRWSHDHAAFVAEVEQENAEREKQRAAAERRYQERLRELTFEQLLKETPLTGWPSDPSGPSPEFTQAARARLHRAAQALIALGPKPRRASVRSVLRETVEWFNQADKAAGGVIETGEREDIVEALEELAHAAKQRALVEEIDRWRDW